jgi:hypothetical protein
MLSSFFPLFQVLDQEMRGDHAILEIATPMSCEDAIAGEHGAPFYGHKLGNYQPRIALTIFFPGVSVFFNCVR